MSGDFTFYWHDYETFGKVPRRDRPSQFAGVRTDVDLKEIGEPLMQYCAPAPDYLPEPEACLLTGILPQTCLEQGVPEHAFASAIEHELAQPAPWAWATTPSALTTRSPATCSGATSSTPMPANGRTAAAAGTCWTWCACTWALRPEGIQWPKHDDGRPSFKLEHLTQANGLTHEAAHDALSDVRATIALARLIKQAQPRLWDFCLKLRQKSAVLAEAGAGPAPRELEAFPAHLGHVRPRARLHGLGLAAGPAPQQQERDDRVGPRARSP
jgi:exodeoxyribonuclease-1